MTKKRIKYRPEFILYKDAIKRFKTENDLVNALKEGNAKAFGDYRPYLDEGPTSEHVPVPTWCWKHYENMKGALFYGHDDPREYINIVIEKASIDHLEEQKKQNRGRPPEYDWGEFFMVVAYHMFAIEGEIEGDRYYKPKSLRDWVRNAGQDYSYFWKDNKIPCENTLKKKLRPLCRSIKAQSDEPLREFFERKYRGGNK